jgi:hypothetical protein
MNKRIPLLINAFVFWLIPFSFAAGGQGNSTDSEQVFFNKGPESMPGNRRSGMFIIDSTHNYLGNTFGQDWFYYQRYQVTDRDQWGNFLNAVTLEYDTIENIWVQHQKYQAAYFDSVTTSLWDARVWDTKAVKWRLSDSIAYNTAGQPIISWYKVWSPLKFRFWRGQRITNVYDAEMLVSRNVQQFDTLSGNWKFDENFTYVYNEDGLLATELIKEWDSATQTWINYSDIQYLYNENLMIQSEVTRFWDEGKLWVNSSKFEYEYFEENNKLKQSTRFIWVNNFGWDVTTRTLYGYDDNLRLVEALSQVWVEFENKWYNTAVYSYFYNSQGQRIKTIYQSWDFGGSWVNESESLYSYNEDGNLSQYAFMTWDDNNNEWLNFYKYVNFWSEFVPFGINELSGPVIQIYPNPTNGVVHLSFQETVKNAMAFVYTMDGKVLFQKSIGNNSAQINLTGLPRGKYLLVIDADGELYSRIIVKD